MVDLNKNPSGSVNNTDDVWNDTETKLLLSVIVEKNIMKLFKNFRYKRADVLQIIENEFQKCGITNKNTLLIDNKWKDLIKMYKFTVKTNVDIVSRGGIPLTCYYYEELDKILANDLLPRRTKSIKSTNLKSTNVQSENVESINIQLSPVQHSTVSKSNPKKCGEVIYVDGQIKYLCFLCPHNDESGQTFEEHFYSNHLKDLVENCSSIKLNNDNSGCDKSALMFEMIEIKEENFPEIITSQINECKIVDTIPKKTHINDHQEEDYNCDFCSMSFPTQKDMLHHFRRYERSRKTCFNCNVRICGRSNYTEHNRKNHKFWDRRSNKSYECYVCKSTLKNSQNLKRHMQTHSGRKPYKCTECDKLLADKSALISHIHTFHKFERPFMCTECGACFPLQRGLKRHIRNHRRNEESPRPCPICARILKNTERLRCHLKTHTDERNFVCTVCDRTFKLRSTYNQHLLIHSKKRLFPCRFCDLSFAQSAGRRGHVRRVHEGIK